MPNSRRRSSVRRRPERSAGQVRRGVDVAEGLAGRVEAAPLLLGDAPRPQIAEQRTEAPLALAEEPARGLGRGSVPDRRRATGGPPRDGRGSPRRRRRPWRGVPRSAREGRRPRGSACHRRPRSRWARARIRGRPAGRRAGRRASRGPRRGGWARRRHRRRERAIVARGDDDDHLRAHGGDGRDGEVEQRAARRSSRPACRTRTGATRRRRGRSR